MLGDQMQPDQIRTFRRVGNGDFDGRLDIWRWALKNSFEALSIKADYGCIRFAPTYPAPKTELYLKQRSRKHGAPPVAPEKFESIREGCVLTLNACLVPQQMKAWDKRPPVVPTLDEFQASLDFVGRFLGISPSYNDLNYGRFEVIDIKETKEYYRQSGGLRP